MNSLSWAIYLIYLVSSLHTLGAFFLGGAIVVSILFFLIWGASEGDFNPYKLKLWRYPVLAFLFGLPLVVVIPDNRTALLIASSEVGEKVLNHEKVKGILDPSTDLLKSWIELETKRIKNELDRQTRK